MAGAAAAAAAAAPAGSAWAGSRGSPMRARVRARGAGRGRRPEGRYALPSRPPPPRPQALLFRPPEPPRARGPLVALVSAQPSAPRVSCQSKWTYPVPPFVTKSETKERNL